MFSYLQMPFLQALGYAIANSIWQVFLLWLIVWLVNSLAKQSSHVRYVTALSGQLAGFVWFLTTFQFYYHHCHLAAIEAQQIANGNAAVYLQNAVANNDNILSALIRAEETLPYLSLAYLLLLLYLIVKWIQNFRFTRTLSVSGLLSIDKQWQAFVTEMSDRLNILQDVKIYLSSVAKSPLTVGYLKPIILLPVASLTYLTIEQTEALILHELAHIKRSDYLINLLVSIAEMVMFFNPFTRLLGRSIQKERENCCDDWVLQYQYSAGMYAEALLRIASFQQQQGFQMSAAGQQKGELLQRIKRLVQPSEKKFSYRYQVTAMMFIAGLLFCIAWLQPGEDDYKTSTQSSRIQKKQVMIAPVTAQVDNPFFNGASLFSSSLHDDVMKQVAEINKAVADSDEVVASLQKIRKVTDKVVPVVMSTLSSANWQQLSKDAVKTAACSLENTTDLFADMPTAIHIDSASLIQIANEALAKADYQKEIQKGLESAKKELEKLQQNRDSENGFSFSVDNLNQLGATALASLQNIHLEVIKDSLRTTSEKIRKAAVRQFEKASEKKARQVMILKQIQDNRNRIVATTNKRTNAVPTPLPPVYTQVPDVNTELPVYSNDCEATEDDVQPASYSWSNNGYSPAAVTYTNAQNQTYKPVKTIHIVQSNDNGNVSITIEIKQ